jgi:RNA polymerase sigma factor (sigma-70 family)
MRGAGPTLTADEEHFLFSALHARNLDDPKRLELYQFLIRVNMPLVRWWLKKHGYTERFTSTDVDDLIQVGNQGVIRAVILFNPRQGTRFITYAPYQIKAYVGRYLDQTMTRPPQGKVTDYRKAMKKLCRELKREPSTEELAAELGWEPSEIAKFSHFYSETSFFERFEKETPPEAPPEEAAPVFDQDAAQLLAVLPARERILLKMRFGIGTQGQRTYYLEEIGERLGLTRGRIRQLQEEALEKLRETPELAARQEKPDDHADVYLLEKFWIPPGHPLFQSLLKLGRTPLERIGALLPDSPQRFPIEPAEGEALPSRIRRLRKSLGLLQKEVAAGAGVSDKTYRDWEKKTAPLRFPHLRSLADYYVQQHSLQPEETARFFGQKDPAAVLQEMHGQPLPAVLRALRTCCWLTQAEAPEAIGMNPAYYHDLEIGNKHPSLFYLRKIAQYYTSKWGFPSKTTRERLGVQNPQETLQKLIGKPLPAALRELRKSIPLSQRGLARKMDMTQRDVRGWESGRHIPEAKNLRKLVGLYAEEYQLPRDLLLKTFGFKSREELLEELQKDSLPQILQKLREFSGKTQEQIGQRLGLSGTGYGAWERGLHPIPIASRYTLAMYYALEHELPFQRLIRLFKVRPPEEVMQEISGENFSGALRILRTSQGLSHEQVSSRLGLTRGAPLEWESGRHLPFPANLQKIISYYSQNHGFPLEPLRQQLTAKWQAQRRGSPEERESPEERMGGLEEIILGEQTLALYP